jgi:hypothetical protein
MKKVVAAAKKVDKKVPAGQKKEKFDFMKMIAKKKK